MKTFLLAVIFLVIGGVIGVAAAIGVGTGIGAGAGIVTGLEIGACAVLDAARKEGFITEENVSKVLGRAGSTLAGHDDVPPDTRPVSTIGDCDRVLAELHDARADS